MLPIHDLQIELLQALSQNNRLILQAPTGSGKSTQVPQMILDSGQVPEGQDIVVLQPRRLAARMLARRVSQERGQTLGQEIGYQVRLDRCISRATRVRYVTEGILLREWLRDPSLSQVGLLVFDEFHERHLFGDLTLAQALLAQQDQRPDLKLILMSATLDTEPLQKFLPDAALLTSEGRSFPVGIRYLPQAPEKTRTPIWQAAAKSIAPLASEDGDILVFMPGRFEIDRTLEAIRRTPIGKQCECLPLHGELPAAEQDRAVRGRGNRRIIVTTNIAETSLTIDGVTWVVDSGMARISRFDPARGVDQLNVEPVSQASADQRAGRAGRTAPGTCIRLWTESSHAARPKRETPEVHRVDLTESVLMLRALGLTDWEALPLPDPPDGAVITRIEAWLRDMGALDEEGSVTPLGQGLLQFPAHPRYARLMLEASRRGVIDAAARITALLQGRPIFVRKSGGQIQRKQQEQFGGDGSSDLLMQERALEYAEGVRFDRAACEDLGIHAGSARQASRLAPTFVKIARRLPRAQSEPIGPEDDELRRCLLVAFSDRLACKRNASTRRVDLRSGGVADLDPDSIVKGAELVIGDELRDLPREKVPQLQGLTRIEPEWLEEMWPLNFEDSIRVEYSEQDKRVLATRERRFDTLVLTSKRLPDVPEDDAVRLLADAVEDGKVPLPGWNDQVDAWITRLNCLAAWCPDWELPPLQEDDRRTLLEHALVGCRSRKDVKNLEIRHHVEEWLSPAQRALVRDHMPERIQLVKGRKARVRYEEGKPPILSATVQDLYDQESSPTVAAGRIRCSIEVLGPNRRPVQLTDDLERFWKESYPMVRKDLKGRYPKHEWR